MMSRCREAGYGTDGINDCAVGSMVESNSAEFGKGATMNRILFVCHGNICRSAMAQCVLQHMVDERGISGRFEIDSAATTNEEIGEPIYPPARRKLVAEGVPILPHRARRIRADEADSWGCIVCMDEENIRHLRRILGEANMGKVRKLLEYAGEHRDVADPWYTGDFDATYRDVVRGCEGLLGSIL